MNHSLKTVDWVDGKLRLIDQTILPARLEFIDYTDYPAVVEAIRSMVVRGAPAIGCTAALGMAIGADSISTESRERFLAELEVIAKSFRGSRPTAVNLFWAIDRIVAVAESSTGTVSEIKAMILDEAISMLDEDIETNRAMGRFGAELLNSGDTVLTHCNAGALATVAFGTALGVIRAAVQQGKQIQVYADETRPRFQGMKLTAWELHQDGIPVTIIADNMSGVLMRDGKISCAVVGADRIAANGDAANKIGTYTVAVLAKHHGIPFYIAAPYSTIDLTLTDGSLIPIEERDSTEVTHIDGHRIAPEGVPVWNPAFDVTPNELITGIITERGVIKAPYRENIARLAG